MSAPPPPPPSSPIAFSPASLISAQALTASLSPSYAVRLSSSTETPSLASSSSSSSTSSSFPSSPSLPLSASRGLRPHRSSLGQPPSTHRLRLSSHTQRTLTKQGTLLHSPVGSEVSLAPSLSSSPLPCSPASSSSLRPTIDQENRHPNAASQPLHASLAGLSLAGGSSTLTKGSNHHALHSNQSLLSPSLSELRSMRRAGAAPSTPLQSFPRPVKRLSFAHATPSSAASATASSSSLPLSSGSLALPSLTPSSTTSFAASNPTSPLPSVAVEAHPLHPTPLSRPIAGVAAAVSFTSHQLSTQPPADHTASRGSNRSASHARMMR